MATKYFSGFPQILYDFSTEGNSIAYLVTDITKNVRFRKEVLKDITLFDEYIIKDGETPEIIANKIYGSPYYNWVIMLANEAYDWINDYPLTDNELDSHIEEVYGSVRQAQQKIKYHTNKAGDIVYYDPSKGRQKYKDASGNERFYNFFEEDGTPPKAITCYDYEVYANEIKRKIKVISPRMLQIVMKNFGELI